MRRMANIILAAVILAGIALNGCSGPPSATGKSEIRNPKSEMGLAGNSAKTLWLDQLDVAKAKSLSTAAPGRGGQPAATRIVAQANKSIDGNDLMINKTRYERGLAVNAPSEFDIDLRGKATRFTAVVGVDDESARAQPQMGMRRGGGRGGMARPSFTIIGDKKILWQSGPVQAGSEPNKLDIALAGVQSLRLIFEGMGAHGDWAMAKIEYAGSEAPVAVDVPVAQKYILTPKEDPKPRLTGAKIFGVRPGNPFLFTVTATGERPMEFSAKDLPAGLTLDSKTGRITGAIEKEGKFTVKLAAKNARGAAERDFRIVAGDTIALTPPMGWNSWNCWGDSVTDAKVRASAKAMVDTGLINHGWTYINIDDFWEVNPGRSQRDPTLAGEQRKPDGTINTNPRFPDMKALTDYIHGLGLKTGLYSSPGPLTCGGCTASYQHEDQDAKTWADWGFDYIKYDWCSYGQIANRLTTERYAKEMSAEDAAKYKELVAQRPGGGRGRGFGGPGAEGDELTALVNKIPADRRRQIDLYILKEPYIQLRKSLDKVRRDIVFSLCQYGNGNVWTWGEEVGGNSWRTTGDITDSWSSVSSLGFGGSDHAQYAKPGHWNDPDMLVLGKVGWGANLHDCRLTPHEQYTHISLWCLACSPLLIGCPIEQLDEFALNLLTNDEVIEVSQDPLGRAARRIVQDGDKEVWAKQMEDGSVAVGFFNRNDYVPQTIAVKLSDLKLKGGCTVRDLWRQKDLGAFKGEFTAEVPVHGVVLIRVTAK